MKNIEIEALTRFELCRDQLGHGKVFQPSEIEEKFAHLETKEALIKYQEELEKENEGKRIPHAIPKLIIQGTSMRMEHKTVNNHCGEPSNSTYICYFGQRANVVLKRREHAPKLEHFGRDGRLRVWLGELSPSEEYNWYKTDKCRPIWEAKRIVDGLHLDHLSERSLEIIKDLVQPLIEHYESSTCVLRGGAVLSDREQSSSDYYEWNDKQNRFHHEWKHVSWQGNVNKFFQQWNDAESRETRNSVAFHEFSIFHELMANGKINQNYELENIAVRYYPDQCKVVFLEVPSEGFIGNVYETSHRATVFEIIESFAEFKDIEELHSFTVQGREPATKQYLLDEMKKFPEFI